MYYWKSYICEPSNLRIEVKDVVYNRLTFHIYRGKTIIYSRDYELTGDLKQETLDELVARLCNVFIRFIKKSDDRSVSAAANELKKVWNKGGLLIWDRSKQRKGKY